jgi:uncharacterized protein Smg (DUF494 family)
MAKATNTGAAMRNRIFEIVVFLIDYMQGDANRLAESDDLWATLEARGYSDDEISSAYSWLLKRFEAAPRHYYSEFPSIQSSRRILSPSERGQFTTEAYGFLIKLHDLSVMDNEQFEAIVDRVAAVGPMPATLEQIKMIVSSVVFSDLDEYDALALFDSDGDFSSFTN